MSSVNPSSPELDDDDDDDDDDDELEEDEEEVLVPAAEELVAAALLAARPIEREYARIICSTSTLPQSVTEGRSSSRGTL